MNSKSAILMSKMGKKKVPSTDSAAELPGVSDEGKTIKEIRSNGFRGTDSVGSLGMFKAAKAIKPAMKVPSTDVVQESAVPSADTVPYSPIKSYLKKRK